LCRARCRTATLCVLAVLLTRARTALDIVFPQLVHPAGHHAEPDRGRGFCMFNNGAIAAEYARKKLGLKKVAIVDVRRLFSSTRALASRAPD
jgi:acetoin utilization deacetylase AcuC-like enzyme